MQIKAFDNKHLRSMNHWLAKRGMMPVRRNELPSNGYIIEGVIVGFIRVVEGDILIFDAFVTNPYASAALRHKAFDALTHFVLSKDCKFFLVLTADAGTLSRAMRHGFKQADFSVLVKDKNVSH